MVSESASVLALMAFKSKPGLNKIQEDNFLHHKFVQFEKQHSRNKAIFRPLLCHRSVVKYASSPLHSRSRFETWPPTNTEIAPFLTLLAESALPTPLWISTPDFWPGSLCLEALWGHLLRVLLSLTLYCCHYGSGFQPGVATPEGVVNQFWRDRD